MVEYHFAESDTWIGLLKKHPTELVYPNQFRNDKENYNRKSICIRQKAERVFNSNLFQTPE